MTITGRTATSIPTANRWMELTCATCPTFQADTRRRTRMRTCGITALRIGGRPRATRGRPSRAPSGRTGGCLTKIKASSPVSITALSGAATAANRPSLPVNNGSWPSLIKLNRTDTNDVVQGQSASVRFFYQWAQPSTSTATVGFYLDDDFNPLNTNQKLLKQMSVPGNGASSGTLICFNSYWFVLSGLK